MKKPFSFSVAAVGLFVLRGDAAVCGEAGDLEQLHEGGGFRGVGLVGVDLHEDHAVHARDAYLSLGRMMR